MNNLAMQIMDFETKEERIMYQMIDFCRKLEKEEKGLGVRTFYDMTKTQTILGVTYAKIIEAIENFDTKYEIELIKT